MTSAANPIKWAMVFQPARQAFNRPIQRLCICVAAISFAHCSSAPLKMAVIGDYGQAGSAQEAVSKLVLGWKPDLVITTGDNNYDSGAAETIDANIGQYWHSFIFPYRGSFGEGATENRFFPSLGNHDWVAQGAQPYLNYFELPGNERYYDFERGPIHFFCLDSDEHEPDGVVENSTQYLWLKQTLSTSASPFNIVYMHHPPYATAASHAALPGLRWPFKEWGVDLVLTGHNHVYERLVVDGLTFVVNGLGGKSKYTFPDSLAPESRAHFSDDYGAMLIQTNGTSLDVNFVTTTGVVIDSFRVSRRLR